MEFCYRRGVNVVKAFDIDLDGHIEVVAGSDDQYVYALESNGSCFWKFFTIDNVMHIKIGNITYSPSIVAITFGPNSVVYAF